MKRCGNNIAIIISAFILWFVPRAFLAAQAKVLPQLGHSDIINAACYSADGKRIYSASKDETIRVWEAETGREITFFSPGSNPLSLAVSGDGETLAAGCWNGDVVLFDTRTGNVKLPSGRHMAAVHAVAFSPANDIVASGSFDRTVRLWDLRAEEGYIREIPFDGAVNAVGFAPDGNQIAVGCGGGTITIINVKTGVQEKTFNMQKAGLANSAVLALRYSPDGKQILAGLWDGTAALFDAATGRLVKKFNDHRAAVNAVDFSADGTMIASASADGSVIIRTLAGKQKPRVLRHDQAVTDVRFGPGGVLSASCDKSLVNWDTTTGERAVTFSGSLYNIDAAACSGDGRRMITATSRTNADGFRISGPIVEWDLANGRMLNTFSGHTLSVRDLAYHPDGKRFASASDDGTVRLWDIESGEARVFNDHAIAVYSVAFSADGTLLASGSQDMNIAVRNLVTGEIKTLTGHTDWVLDIAFNPVAPQLVSVSKDQTGKIWDLTTGADIRSLNGHSSTINTVAYSGDGRYIASGANDNNVIMWSAETGAQLEVLKGHREYVNSVCFTPDGRYVVSASGELTASDDDKTVRVWDVRTFEQKAVLTGHSNEVLSVVCTPGRIISASADGTIRYWELAASDGGVTGRCLARFIPFTDGEWIVAGSGDYYNASPRGDSHLNVIVDGEAYTMYQYRDVFYQPAKVTACLWGADAADADVDIEDFVPPRLEVTESDGVNGNRIRVGVTPVSLSRTSTHTVTLSVWVNGVAAAEEEVPSGAAERFYDLKLKPGTNYVRVSASNGRAEETKSLWIKGPENANTELPGLRMLAIGVNNFDEPDITDLDAARNDALAFLFALNSQKNKTFSSIASDVITGDEHHTVPTYANITAGLPYLEKTGADDIAVLFVSSHGTYQGTEFGFAAQDSVYDAEGNITNIVTSDVISATLSKVKGRKLIFLNTCFSGGLDNDGLIRRLEGEGTAIFASSTGSEVSYSGGRYGLSFFNYSVIDGLSGKADRDGGNGDGLITLAELEAYVKQKVPEMSFGKQTPYVFIPEGMKNFVIADTN